MASGDDLLTEQSAAGSRLRLRWIRENDRFRQVIEQVRGDEARLLLESVDLQSGGSEGVVDLHGTGTGGAWPPSPPLQQLHIEDRGTAGRVALLVGMAGRSHWSMSVASEPGRASLQYDVACRYSQVPEFLGSAWRLCVPGRWQQCDPLRVRAIDALGERLVDLSVSTATGDDCVTCTLVGEGEEGEREVRVVCESSVTRLPRTARWIYSIEYLW